MLLAHAAQVHLQSILLAAVGWPQGWVGFSKWTRWTSQRTDPPQVGMGWLLSRKPYVPTRTLGVSLSQWKILFYFTGWWIYNSFLQIQTSCPGIFCTHSWSWISPSWVFWGGGTCKLLANRLMTKTFNSSNVQRHFIHSLILDLLVPVAPPWGSQYSPPKMSWGMWAEKTKRLTGMLPTTLDRAL